MLPVHDEMLVCVNLNMLALIMQEPHQNFFCGGSEGTSQRPEECNT